MKYLLITLFLFTNAFAGEHFNKVLWIVFENANYAQVIQNPVFKKMADQGALFTHLMAETHPSQGNYIAMIAGSTMGVKNDNNIDLSGKHVGDLLEAQGMHFKVYAEDYPGNCYLKPTSNYFARKHVPFLSFKNVTSNTARCLNIEDEKNFEHDILNNQLSEFSMYIPNLQNDGHNTGINFAANWFDHKFKDLFTHPELFKDVLVIITFDEGGASASNQVYTALWGAKIKPQSSNSQIQTHVSLLRMIEDEFKLGNLGRDDATALPITNIWK